MTRPSIDAAMHASSIMRRTQIFLEPEQSQELARPADVRGVTSSHLIREAIAHYLADPMDEAGELAAQRSALLEAAGTIPGLASGAETVERLRDADAARRVELLRGLRSHERGAVERLFAGLRWVTVTEPIARRAGELGRTWRRSHRGVASIDLIIAATALELGAELATANVRHFPMFPDLQPPYR